jgi:hypothetical protein
MRLRLVVAALAASLLPAAPALAAGDPTMPLSQVHSGMHCTGYSVVRGTDIASFDVDVIDVIDGDPNEDGPRILVQASGPAVDSTGIGPGFSGSPIYCDDGTGTQRNIGAISESIGEYGGKTVLATPIEAILANPVDAPRGHNDMAHATTRAGVARRAGASPAGRARAARLRDRTRDPRAAAAVRAIRRGEVHELASPLTVSGLSRGLAQGLADAGKRLGRPVLAAPAGPLGSFPVQTMRPGSAVSVGYSSGDLRIGAIGTVAYTDGDSVWAFGHPFEGSGARALFLQDAYVYKVINDPNAATDGGSYKYASAGHDIGTLTNDAADAVVGRTGVLPPSIPIRVAAHDLDTGRSLVLHVTSADETDAGTTTGFSPVSSVAPLAIAQAGSNVLGSAPGRLTGRMCLTIVFRETKRHGRFCNRYVSSSTADAQDFAGGNTVAVNGALDAVDALGLVDSYTGRTPHIAKVSAKLDLQRGERSAMLRNVHAPRTVHAGQSIKVHVGLQKLRGSRVTRVYTVRIPRGAKPGRHRLVLRARDGSGGSANDLFSDVLTLDTGTPDTGPTTLRGLVDAIRAESRADGVDVKLGGRTGKGFRDDRLILTGRATTRIRVVR